MLLFERDLPDAYQGHWLEILGVIFVAFVLTAIGQMLGNDICGSNRAMVDRATESEYRRFHRGNFADRYFMIRFYEGLFVNIRGALRIFSSGD